jgi:hypothetical protein
VAERYIVEDHGSLVTGSGKLVLITETTNLIQLQWKPEDSDNPKSRHFVTAVPLPEETAGAVQLYVWALRVKEDQKPVVIGFMEKGAVESWMR